MSLGRSRFSHIRTVLMLPSALETSIRSVPEKPNAQHVIQEHTQSCRWMHIRHQKYDFMQQYVKWGCLPASVQYSLLVTQSIAKPAGLSRLVSTTTWKNRDNRIEHLPLMLMNQEYKYSAIISSCIIIIAVFSCFRPHGFSLFVYWVFRVFFSLPLQVESVLWTIQWTESDLQQLTPAPTFSSAEHKLLLHCHINPSRWQYCTGLNPAVLCCCYFLINPGQMMRTDGIWVEFRLWMSLTSCLEPFHSALLMESVVTSVQ